MQIEWDAKKNAANKRKHGLSFEEASELFTSGVDYLEVFDAAHSEEEDRFINIGPVKRGVIVVVTTVPEDTVLRIVSARPATSREAGMWAKQMKGKADV